MATAIPAYRDGNRFDYTNGTGTDIPTRAIIAFADRIGIADGFIAIGITGTVWLEGSYDLPLATGVTPAQGDKVYWSDSTQEITDTITDTPAGFYEGLSSGLARVNIGK